MKKIFIAIGLVLFISMVVSTMDKKPVQKQSPEEARINDSLANDMFNSFDTYEEPERKYYFKGQEITKEEYDNYQNQINQLIQQVEVTKAVIEAYERSKPNITYRKYSNGYVETRIDE